MEEEAKPAKKAKAVRPKKAIAAAEDAAKEEIKDDDADVATETSKVKAEEAEDGGEA